MTRPRPARTARPLLLAVCAGVLLTLTGCGNAGGPKSAGPTPSAVGPVRLWPEHPPAKPQYDGAEATIEVVKGIAAPKSGKLRDIDPVKVVKTEIGAHPDTYTGPDGLPEDTAAAIADCPDDKKPDAVVKGCPVLQAYYRDLTGNGNDELIVGLDYSEGSLGIRVYSLDGDRLLRIMATSQPVTDVELAGRELVLRSPATSPGYEYRDVWSWDEQRHAMFPARMEVVRTKSGEEPSPSAATP